MKLVNEQCRDQALKYAVIGNHVMAMRWYNSAAARTIGHKKSADYVALAKEQAKLAGAFFDSMMFAEDWEAM